MHWRLSDRFDPSLLPLADRHYTRQKVGSKQFVRPGRCLVLASGSPADAVWVTSWQQHAKHDWAGLWECTIFRNEGPVVSSRLILEAMAATRWWAANGPESWRQPEPDGMITFIQPSKIRSPNPGYCYKMAGWRVAGASRKRGYPCLIIDTPNMPPATPPVIPPSRAPAPDRQLHLF